MKIARRTIKLSHLSPSHGPRWRPYHALRRWAMYTALSWAFLQGLQAYLDFWLGPQLNVAGSAILGAVLWAANLGRGAEAWRELRDGPATIEGAPLKVMLAHTGRGVRKF